MLPARALVYAILISAIIATISGALVSLSYTQNILQRTEFNRQRLLRNVDSGIQLLLGSTAEELSPTAFDLFGDGNDTLVIEKRAWGLLSVATSLGIIHQGKYTDTLVRAALFGAPLIEESQSALYLADANAPLSLCGETRIVGKAYLPREGVKRGYVLGRNYTGEKLIYGAESRSKPQAPSLEKERAERLLKMFDLERTTAAIEDSLVWSFLAPPVIIREKTIYVSGTDWQGNIILVADSLIQFAPDCRVENILAFAPQIQFQSGFKGQLQAFAKEFITAEKDCLFTYPSVLGVIRKKEVDNTGIYLDSYCELDGMIFSKEYEYNRRKTKITLEDTTFVHGQVLTDGLLDMKGRVHGNVTCQKISLRTSASIHENHLMDATLDYTRLSPLFLGGMIRQNQVGKQGIIQWLE